MMLHFVGANIQIMPFIAFDDDVSGSGSANWASTGVFYVSVDITTLGALPRQIDDIDHFVRAGWFALGEQFDIGLGTFEYWAEPVHVDFEHFRWSPTPDLDASAGFMTKLASRIRWHFNAGVSAHIHVFAN